MTGGRNGWWIGILVFGLMVYILLNTLRTEGPGSRGLEQRSDVPDFAAPLVLEGLEGDVNVATKENLGEAGAVPACEIKRDDVLNGCDLVRDAPAVIGFYFDRGADCEPAFDALERVHRRFPKVNVAGIILGDRDKARATVRESGWTFPIAHDRDGALSTVFGVVVCPEFVLSLPGGEVHSTIIGETVNLEEEVAVLVDRARDEGGSP